MDSDMKYCRSCGKQIRRDAKFCKYCGYRLIGDAESKEAPQIPRPESERKPQSPRPEPVRKPQISRSELIQKPQTGKEKKGGGRKFVAFLLIAGLLFTGFYKPGFFLKKPDAPGTVTGPLAELRYDATSESAVLSSDCLTADFSESGVAVSLTEFVLDAGQSAELKVESLEPVYAPNGDYVIRPYQVNLGDIHEMKDFIEIRIPYDTSFCDPGEDPAECVGGVYLNPETGEWEETLYTVDAEAGEVVIETDHFSEFGAMTVRNKGRRDALLSGGSAGYAGNDGDIGYLTEAQAISTLQALCETQSADTLAARLAGNQAVQAAMALGGAASDMADTAGAAYNFAYYLDLSDLAMKGNYLEIAPEIEVWGYKLGSKLDPKYAYSNHTFNIYNNDTAMRSGRILSNVGNILSGCKVAYLAGKAASGNAETSEIFQLYKDTASLAISLSGSVTLSALMGPVMLADTFINYMFTESFAIKEGQIEEMYMWFNDKYPGTGAPNYTRPGRNAPAWRKVIIDLIDENPGADTAEILETEVNDFCDDFWSLSSDELSDVVAQMPQTIKRITVDDERIRTKITDGYKQQLYTVLNETVMPSVRNYYNKKMLLEAQKSLSKAKKFYNQTITFDVFEAEHTDSEGRTGDEADSLYGGYPCAFLPLAADADLSNWSSTLPEKNVGLHGEFTLIGYLTAGEPKYFAVFEPGADMRTDDPVLVVPLPVSGEIDGGQNLRIILGEEKPAGDLSAFLGSWYDEDGYEIRIEETPDGRVGIYNFGWSEDWLYAGYTMRPDKKSVTIGGEEYPLDDTDVLVQLIEPQASTYALPSSYEHFMGVDGTGTRLALFIAGGVYGYMREKPEIQETEIDLYYPIDYDQVIPPGGDE